MSKLGKTVRVRLEGKLKGKKRIIKVVKSKRRKKIVEKAVERSKNNSG